MSSSKSTYHSISNNDDDVKEEDLLKTTDIDSKDNDGGSNDNNGMNQYLHLLLPLCFLNLIDAISFMIVAPSLVFYVIDVMHGTKEQYGIILSSFSFTSFLFKPVLGYWCDNTGGLFRIPYFVSISAASLGGFIYFMASVVPSSLSLDTSSTTMNADADSNATGSEQATRNTIGLLLIFLGRLLGGMGAANSTLGFTYIAEVIPHESMTKATSILSTVRIVGMALAPTFNIILNKVHIIIPLSSTLVIEINSLNSVGLVLCFGNLLGLLIMYFTFHEPDPNKRNSTKVSSSITSATSSSSSSDDVDDTNDDVMNENVDGWTFWKSVLSIDILIPIFIIFSLNVNFQLLETALAPAASDALRWGPIEVSSVFSFNAILMFFVIMTTYQLSSYGVADMSFLFVGETISMIGYSLLYLLWKKDAAVWQFVLPVILSIACFPLLGAPARTVYTELVSAQPYLASHQGTMQALISMSASVAGFVAPGLIASYILRSPTAVANSDDQREFTKWALMAPFFSLLSFLGVLHLYKHTDIQIAKSDKRNLLETTIETVDNIGNGENENKAYEWKDHHVSCEEGKSLLRHVGEVMLPEGSHCHRQKKQQKQKFCPKTEAYRKETTTLMGIHQISFMEHPSSFSNGTKSNHNGRRETVRF